MQTDIHQSVYKEENYAQTVIADYSLYHVLFNRHRNIKMAAVKRKVNRQKLENMNQVINIRGCNSVMIGENNRYMTVNPNEDQNEEEETMEEYNVEEPVEDSSELVQFVGRQREREWIKTRIKEGHRLIQLHGQGMVGKKRLARQAVLELKKEEAGQFNVIHISCLNLNSWMEFLTTFYKKCFRRNSDTVSLDEIIMNSQEILQKNKRLVVLVTNCEILDRLSTGKDGKEFDKFVLDYLRECTNVAMIVTSQKRFHFECSSQDKWVVPLSDKDTMMLLQFVLHGIDVLPYKEVIIEHCYGLPPYILDATACLKGNINLGMTVDDLKECLRDENRSRRIHSNHHPSTSEELFPGLTNYLQQKVIDLSIFRGSFGSDSFAAIIGGTNVQNSLKTKQDLYELQQYSVITTIGKSSRSSRMRLTEYYSYLSSVLKERVTYNDVVRLRFVMFFGEILSRANVDLYITSQQTVYGYLKDDWLNLEQVLKEAIHCTENTFGAFMKVATDADNLIIKCFPAEAMCFYEKMSEVTEMYGTYEDKAVLEAKLGRAITHTKGDGLEKAMKLFEEALDVLEGTGASKELVALYQDLAYNLYKRGKYQEALRCCKNSLKTAEMMKLTPQLTNQIISVRSLLAIPHIFLGHFSTAEALLEETLDLAKQVTPFHPSISIMINSIGLLYERSGRDDDLALQFYRASLVERRKFENMFPADLVIALNNVGMQHSKRGQHRQALKHLEEAYMIRQRIGKMDFNTALTLWHMGRVNMLLCDLPTASNLLNEAVHIYNKCAQHHSVHIHVRLVQAHCYILQNMMSEAQKSLQETLDFRENFISQTPKAVHLLLVMGHLLMLVQSDRLLLLQTLTAFNKELDRYIVANDGKVSQEIHSLSFGCQDCIHAVTDGRSPNFDFLQSLYKPCFVCKDLEDVGYKNKVFWDQATLSMKSKADFKTLLMSSAVLKVATSEEAINEASNEPSKRYRLKKHLPSEDISEGDCKQENRNVTPSIVFQQILKVSSEKSTYLVSEESGVCPENSTIKHVHPVAVEDQTSQFIVNSGQGDQCDYLERRAPSGCEKNNLFLDSKTKSVLQPSEYGNSHSEDIPPQRGFKQVISEGSPAKVLTEAGFRKTTVQNSSSEGLVSKTDENIQPKSSKSSAVEFRAARMAGTEQAKQGLLPAVKASINGHQNELPVRCDKGNHFVIGSRGNVDGIEEKIMVNDDLDYGLGDKSLVSIQHDNRTLEDLMPKTNDTKDYCENDESVDAPHEGGNNSGSTDVSCKVINGSKTSRNIEEKSYQLEAAYDGSKSSDSFEMLGKSVETSQSVEVPYEAHLRKLQEERFSVFASSRELRSTNCVNEESQKNEIPPSSKGAACMTSEAGFLVGRTTNLSFNGKNNLNRQSKEKNGDKASEFSEKVKNNVKGKNIPNFVFVNESLMNDSVQNGLRKLQDDLAPNTSGCFNGQGVKGDSYPNQTSNPNRPEQTFNLPTFLDSVVTSGSTDDQFCWGFGDFQDSKGREPLESDERLSTGSNRLCCLDESCNCSMSNQRM